MGSAALDDGAYLGGEDEANHGTMLVHLLDMPHQTRRCHNGPIRLQTDILASIDNKSIEHLIRIPADHLGGDDLTGRVPLSEQQRRTQALVFLLRFPQTHVIQSECNILREQELGALFTLRKADHPRKYPLSSRPGRDTQLPSNRFLALHREAEKRKGCQDT